MIDYFIQFRTLPRISVRWAETGRARILLSGGEDEVNSDYQYWVSKLGLLRHPEGGYFKEVYRSPEMISDLELSVQFTDKRNLATSIYFLLTSNDVSHFHRLNADELWYYHTGSSLTIFMVDRQGVLKELKLGLNLEQGELPQVVIPSGTIFGALVNDPDTFSLVSCMVAQGFDFRDFELLSRESLLQEYPQHEEIVLKLT